MSGVLGARWNAGSAPCSQQAVTGGTWLPGSTRTGTVRNAAMSLFRNGAAPPPPARREPALGTVQQHWCGVGQQNSTTLWDGVGNGLP